jgi:hypothetical protein
MDYNFGCEKLVSFTCEKCDFNTSHKWRYDRHILTEKHKRVTLDDNKSVKSCASYSCNCGKEYKFRQGLWKHQKNCESMTNNYIINKDYDKSELKDLTNLVLDVIKQNKELTYQNQELTNKIVDICKNNSNTNISNSNFNSNNKTFNLSVFLNETCKDAMNIMDFVDSIKLQLSDLENVSDMGYIDGISNIIVQHLKALDIDKRPVHCTDKKREILYIRDENKWEKECENKQKLRKAIKRVVTKNQRLLPVYKEIHPDCVKSSSPFSDQYNKMIIESMGGTGNNDLEKEDKIIKKITKEVVIDKNIY